MNAKNDYTQNNIKSLYELLKENDNIEFFVVILLIT